MDNMNTPPPPPMHTLHRSYTSPFELYTPTEDSFDEYSNAGDSDRYTDVPIHRTQSSRPHIETRRPSFHHAESYSGPPLIIPATATPTTMSTGSSKDYLYFAYTKNGSRWDENPIIEEIPAPQSQIRKRVEKGNKKGTALQHLRKMGPNRRGHIERHIRMLNNQELDGSFWEAVWIDDTQIRPKGTTMEVKAFEIILARRQPRVRRASTPFSPFIPTVSEPEIIKTEPILEKPKKDKKERRKSKSRREDMSATGPTLIDDPFGETQWFDATGAAAGAQGTFPSGITALPPKIPPEKPIGTLQPRIIQGLDPEKDEMHGFAPVAQRSRNNQTSGFGTPLEPEDVLRNLPNITPHNDGIVVVNDSRHDRRRPIREYRGRDQHHGSRSRSRSRGHSLNNGDHATRSRNVRFSDQSLPEYPYAFSDSSSMGSREGGFIFDEVEELSSRSSEDTYGSPSGQKIYRPVAPANRQHRPGPVRTTSQNKYELVSDEKIVTPARSRRRSSQAIEPPQMQQPYGFEQPQPLVRRNTSPRQKATVHQPAPPPAQPVAEVPPIAVFPSYYEERERERDRDRRRDYEEEQRANDYMRDTLRERTLREREDELAQRERALLDNEFFAQKDEERRQRETSAIREQLESLRLGREFGVRRSVYTHEPRDAYNARR